MHSRLVNDLMQDPLLYTGFDSSPDRILFDCGYMFGLSLREIQRISSVFVSHTHFDHFMGFDHMLRLSIEQDRKIEVYGPEGIISQTAGKLSGYSWNLCHDLALNFEVFEIAPPFIRKAILCASEAFRLGDISVSEFSGVLKRGKGYAVSVAVLDHIIPSLAFSIKEDDMFKVNDENLALCGIKPGPWLGRLKNEYAVGCVADGYIEGPDGTPVSRPKLADSLFYLKKGRKVSYIVDTVFNERTSSDASALAFESDDLYCECAFLDEDAEKAGDVHHLTASQAATIALMSGSKRLYPIHLSKRYNGRFKELFCEAWRIFPHVFMSGKGEFIPK